MDVLSGLKATLADWRDWRRRPFVLAAVLLVIVGGYWLAIGVKLGRAPNYMSTEGRTVLSLSPTQILGPMTIVDPEGKSPTYYMFSPLGFNLVAFLDRYVIAPLVVRKTLDVQTFTSARRLLGFHVGLIALATLTLGILLIQAFGWQWGVAASLIYFGLNDGFLHALYFVGTIGLHVQLIGAMACAAGLAHALVHGANRRNLAAIGIGLVAAILAHPQSASLPVALIAASAVAAWLWRLPWSRWGIVGLIFPLAGLGLYLLMRLGYGLAETGRVSEAQYVFAYPSKLLMLEEIVVNASYHIANVVDSVAMPWPMFSVAIFSKLDMGVLNQYNLTYSKWPNMHYRLLGLWYAGLLFGLAVWGSVTVARRLLSSPLAVPSAIAVIGLGLMWLGFSMHLPIMHRDYFAQPGFNLGYKSVLSVLGLALMMPFIWAELIAPRIAMLMPRTQTRIGAAICVWLALCAVGKVVLLPPYGYPW
jgi:hypothetical protein